MFFCLTYWWQLLRGDTLRPSTQYSQLVQFSFWKTNSALKNEGSKVINISAIYLNGFWIVDWWLFQANCPPYTRLNTFRNKYWRQGSVVKTQYDQLLSGQRERELEQSWTPAWLYSKLPLFISQKVLTFWRRAVVCLSGSLFPASEWGLNN